MDVFNIVISNSFEEINRLRKGINRLLSKGIWMFLRPFVNLCIGTSALELELEMELELELILQTQLFPVP